MESMEKFQELVKKQYSGLSAAQKKVAEYILHNMEKVAFSTVVQIGREVDVSDTTVIRLSYALGFSGFSSMQQCIQQQILKNSASTSTERTAETAHPADATDPLAHLLHKEIQAMEKTLTNVDLDLVWKVAEAIVQADQVLVIGYRGSYTVAYWFSSMLSLLRDHVHLLPMAGGFYEKSFTLNEHSAVLAVSFPRYAKQTLQAAEAAKQQGATLISVTDRVLSPVGQLSDLTLTTPIEVNTDTGLVSFAPAISLLHAVILGIRCKDSARIDDRQSRMEHMYAMHDVFIE